MIGLAVLMLIVTFPEAAGAILGGLAVASVVYAVGMFVYTLGLHSWELLIGLGQLIVALIGLRK